MEKRDSGLYRCLNEPSRGNLTECDSTSSFCTSGDHEEESAGAVTQSSCEAALLLYISGESGGLFHIFNPQDILSLSIVKNILSWSITS